LQKVNNALAPKVKSLELAIICSKLQKVNNAIAPKVKSLEEELHKAKTDLVSLELTCLHASIKTC